MLVDISYFTHFALRIACHLKLKVISQL